MNIDSGQSGGIIILSLQSFDSDLMVCDDNCNSPFQKK